MQIKHGVIFLFLGFITACATVPYTKRHQFNLVSQEDEIKLGEDAYADTLKKNPRSKNEEYQRRVREVGERISKAAHQPNFKWEFNVLGGKEINAFCLPGGKVAFWEAIIPVCETDDGIAVVMGHEVAHALAHHGAERMSQGMGAEIIGQILEAGLGQSDPAVRDNALKAYGLGAQFGVMLPFSRAHESEADHIGLILMATAGYDPHYAVNFWQRMAKQGAGNKSGNSLESLASRFASTHPTDEKRIEQIKAWLPEALSYYKP